MYFEAAPGDPALKISALRGSRPSPPSGRFDNLLKNPGGMGMADWRREFEFAKWWPNKIGQSRFEIRPGNRFGFKHCASYDATIVTDASRYSTRARPRLSDRAFVLIRGRMHLNRNFFDFLAQAFLAFKQPTRDSFADDQRREVGVGARYHGNDRRVSDVSVVEAVNSSARIDDRGPIARRAHPASPHRMVVVQAVGPDERLDLGAGRDGAAG